MQRVTGENNLADRYAWLYQDIALEAEDSIETFSGTEPSLWVPAVNAPQAPLLNRVPSVMRTDSEYPSYIYEVPMATSTSETSSTFRERWSAFLENFFSEEGFRSKLKEDSPIPDFFKENRLICEICERISLSPSISTYRGKTYSDITLCRHCLFVGCLLSDGSGFSNFKLDELRVQRDEAKEDLAQALKEDDSVEKSFLSTKMDYGEVDAPSKEKWGHLYSIFGSDLPQIARDLGIQDEQIPTRNEAIGKCPAKGWVSDSEGDE